jgi:hypothetical protein
VAPRRVQIVLALEVTTSWWPTNLADRDTQAYTCSLIVARGADKEDRAAAT